LGPSPGGELNVPASREPAAGTFCFETEDSAGSARLIPVGGEGKGNGWRGRFYQLTTITDLSVTD